MRSLVKLARDLIELHRDVGGSAIRLIDIDEHIDAGWQPGGEGALQGRANLLRPLAQFSIASQRLNHLIVANTRRKLSRRRVPDDGLLGMLDLTPGAVIADH